jgi:hypothetical protein
VNGEEWDNVVLAGEGAGESAGHDGSITGK